MSQGAAPAGGRRRLWLAAAIFVVSLAVYLSNGRTIWSGDTVPASLMPITLVLDGTVMLDRFAEQERLRFGPHPYFLATTKYGVASVYPLATGLIATPVYVVPIVLQRWRGEPTAAEWTAILGTLVAFVLPARGAHIGGPEGSATSIPLRSNWRRRGAENERGRHFLRLSQPGAKNMKTIWVMALLLLSACQANDNVGKFQITTQADHQGPTQDRAGPGENGQRDGHW